MSSPLNSMSWADRTVNQSQTPEDIDSAFDTLHLMEERERNMAVSLAETMLLQGLQSELAGKDFKKLKTLFNVARVASTVLGSDLLKKTENDLKKDHNDYEKITAEFSIVRRLAEKIQEYRQEKSHPMTRAIVEETQKLSSPEKSGPLVGIRLMIRLEKRFRQEKNKAAGGRGGFWNRLRGKKPGM